MNAVAESSVVAALPTHEPCLLRHCLAVYGAPVASPAADDGAAAAGRSDAGAGVEAAAGTGPAAGSDAGAEAAAAMAPAAGSEAEGMDTEPKGEGGTYALSLEKVAVYLAHKEFRKLHPNTSVQRKHIACDEFMQNWEAAMPTTDYKPSESLLAGLALKEGVKSNAKGEDEVRGGRGGGGRGGAAASAQERRCPYRRGGVRTGAAVSAQARRCPHRRGGVRTGARRRAVWFRTLSRNLYHSYLNGPPLSTLTASALSHLSLSFPASLPPSPPQYVYRYLPEASLPLDAEARFNRLFEERTKWTKVGEGCERGAVTLWGCRSCCPFV